MRNHALALAALLCACGGSRRADGPVRVYVSNEDAGTISVIDGRTHAVLATIPVGKRPRGLRVSPDGKTLFVALSGSPKSPPGVDPATLPPPDRAADGIGVVDLERGELVRTLQSGQDPECFDLVDGGRTLVVSNEETAEASIVDVATGQVRARVPVGGEPEGVTTHPAGDVVYVTSEEDHRIDVVDPREARVVATIPTGERPRAIAFSRDGATAYVSNENGTSVTVIDARRHVARATIAIPRDGSGPAGPRPMGVALTRDGEHVLVSNGRGGSLAVIDADDGAIVRTIGEIGARPWGVAVAPDGVAYTANGPTDDVSLVDPVGGTVLKRIAVGDSPWGVAVHP